MKASKNAKANMEKSAPINDFLMSEIFDLFSSSSNEPSNTMSSNPMLPDTVRARVKSGSWISENKATCFIIRPFISTSLNVMKT